LGSSDSEQARIALNLAIMCTDQSPSLRPTMSQVVAVLERSKTLEDISKEINTLAWFGVCPALPDGRYSLWLCVLFSFSTFMDSYLLGFFFLMSLCFSKRSIPWNDLQSVLQDLMVDIACDCVVCQFLYIYGYLSHCFLLFLDVLVFFIGIFLENIGVKKYSLWYHKRVLLFF
jgi:hypothetical protein